VASYGIMILFSFLFARKRYRIEYNMKELLPYFIFAVAIAVFGVSFPYPDLITELAINTVLLLLFILYVQKKERLAEVFFRK
jgi:uncharacterized membrane protein YfcA